MNLNQLIIIPGRHKTILNFWVEIQAASRSLISSGSNKAKSHLSNKSRRVFPSRRDTETASAELKLPSSLSQHRTLFPKGGKKNPSVVFLMFHFATAFPLPPTAAAWPSSRINICSRGWQRSNDETRSQWTFIAQFTSIQNMKKTEIYGT